MFYLEACESGSIFEGVLPPSVKVYATTAANAEESSWGTYCPGMDPAPPTEFWTCLGDLYSVAWMEDRYRKKEGAGGLGRHGYLKLHGGQVAAAASSGGAAFTEVHLALSAPLPCAALPCS